MTQKNFILNFFENIFRSNIYLFLIFRFYIGKYFSTIIYDNDFNFLKILNKNKFFKTQKLIIDIGANDGSSYKIIRKIVFDSKIFSFEPISYNYKNLKKIESRDKLFKCKKVALSNSNREKVFFFTAFFKKYPITQLAGISKSGLKKRIKYSFEIKDILKKITIKKEFLSTRKLDNYKFKPRFIKIDIEGHEYECILGSLKTIRKYKPIIMVEHDKHISKKIYKLLKKLKYQKFIYNKKTNEIEKFNKQKILNLFFINKKDLKFIK